MVYQQGAAYSPHKGTEWWHFMFLILYPLLIFSNLNNYCTNYWSKQNNACVIMPNHQISGGFSRWCLKTLPYFVDVKWQQGLHHLCSVNADLRGFDHSSIAWGIKPPRMLFLYHHFVFQTTLELLSNHTSNWKLVMQTWIPDIQIYRFLRTHIYTRCLGLP